MTDRRGFVYMDIFCTIMIMALIYAMLVGAWTHSLDKARRGLCVQNMKETSVALRAYALDYAGAFPRQSNGLATLCDQYAADRGILVCPQVEHWTKQHPDTTPPSRLADRPELPIDYAYRGGLYSDDLPSLALVMDFSVHQHQGGANVLYLDGHAEWQALPQTEADADAGQLLSSGALDVLPSLRGPVE